MKKTSFITILLIIIILFTNCSIYKENVKQKENTPLVLSSAEPENTVKSTAETEATSSPDNTESVEPSPTITATISPTDFIVTPTAVFSATPTVTPTAPPTATLIITPSHTLKPTETPIITPKPTLKPTPTATPIPTPTPTEAPTPSPTPKISVTSSMLREIENGFLHLVNGERQSLGLSALTINAHLDSCAEIRADEIITSFSHTRPNGESCFSLIDSSKYNYKTVGENICMTSHVGSGYITPFTGSAEQIEAVYTHMFNLFKNSPGHYANMIDTDFEHCGIGISYKMEKGIPMFYCAHMFGADF